MIIVMVCPPTFLYLRTRGIYRGQTLQVHSNNHMYDNCNGLSPYTPLTKDSWNVQGTNILSSIVLVVLA